MTQSSRPALRRELSELVKASSGDLPSVLYHYTGPESFRRILETRRLLATHYEFTNDPTELRYGQGLVAEETRRTLAGLGPNVSWAEPILHRVLAKIESEGFHDDMPTFVTCFSADGDNLGQWRAYAQDGRGYAIGFDTKKWEYINSNGSIGPVLVECRYDSTQMATEIAEQQQRILEEGAKLRTPAGSEALNYEAHLEVEKALFLVGAFATLRMKDHGFRDEKEWRLVALPDESERGTPSGQCVREVGGVFAPAIALRLGQDDRRFPLRRIVIGPCHAQEGRTKIAEYGVKELLRLTDTAAPNEGFIKSSRIPYRSRPRHG